MTINERVDERNQDFNNYIHLAKHTIEYIIQNDQIREKYKTRLREISEKYPAMFTQARADYPQLFGVTGPDNKPDQLKNSELVERIKREPSMHLRLFGGERRGTRQQRNSDEITMRQAVGEIKDLLRELVQQFRPDQQNREIVALLEEGVPAVCESQEIQALNERNAIRRYITATWKHPDLQRNLMELLEVPRNTPDHSLARTALAFAYTSKCIEYLMESPKDNLADIMKKALQEAQKEKTHILENPRKVFVLPIRYRSRNIQVGRLQAVTSITSHERSHIEKDLTQRQFTQDEEGKWEKWQRQSHVNLRCNLTSLGLSFQGEKVLSLEQMNLAKPENDNRVMCKLTTEKKTYFLNISGSHLPMHNIVFTYPLRFLSGMEVEMNWAACHRDPFSAGYWVNKDVDWHVHPQHREAYHSTIYPMMVDHVSNAFRNLVDQGRKKIYIVDIGGGSGALTESIRNHIEKQYPDIPVEYHLLDLSEPDIATAIERFERRHSSRWDIRSLVKNIFDYQFNAEEALRNMKIPEKVDIILSSGGPFSPRVGGDRNQALQLIPMCAGMLARGGRLLISGTSGVWPNRSDFEDHEMDVLNIFDPLNKREMYVVQNSDLK